MAKKLTKKQVAALKKAAVKHPKGGIIITIIILLALIAGALYYFLVINKPEVKTYFRLVGLDTVSVAIDGTYNEQGFGCFYKNEDVSSSVTVTYYNSDNETVTNIDTSKEATFTAKYVADSQYSFETNTLQRTINVTAVEPIQINFLELGNKYTGDSIYIKAGNTDILIDAGSQKNSATAISNYVDQYCTDGVLEYVISTHAHEDHIAGFVGSKSDTGIFYKYKIDTLIDFPLTESTSQLYKDYVDIRTSKISSGDIKHHYTALECWNNFNGAKRSYDIAAGTTLDILYQKYYETSAKNNENNYSVCAMINHGENHYLFTGDLEKDGEESLIASNSLPEVTLFKAAHHGSYTANSDDLLKIIKPKNIVVCCSAGNTKYTEVALNTFPSQNAINTMSKYTDKIYVTTVDYGDSYGPLNGTIKFVCEKGSDYKITGSNNSTILKDTEWFKNNRTWPTA